jgi:hypothetical protein
VTVPLQIIKVLLSPGERSSLSEQVAHLHGCLGWDLGVKDE